MKTLRKLTVVESVGVAAIALFALVQTVRPGIPVKPPTAELQAPAEVKRILEKNCYSCHSNQPRLSWFDQVVPAYWLVRHDVLTARKHLNFSTLGSQPAAEQKAALYEAVNMIQLGAMPLPSFTKLHPDAKVTAQELSTLKAYLAPWALAPGGPAQASAPVNPPGSTEAPAKTPPAAVSELSPAPVTLSAVHPELDGLSFDPTFENWKVISTTDRGDNNTFRFILGNDVAVRAVLLGDLPRWPDGARLAKVAWQKELGTDGMLHPGKFVQVELMVKDTRIYKSTGWGWGRWRGLDLKPYGNDGHFVTECKSCHLPVRGNDYVYTLPLTTASLKGGVEVVNNRAAALPVSLPYQPLDRNPITMYADPKAHTMSILFGNEAAMRDVQARSAKGAGAAPAYRAGSELALVTWAQRDDPHWFGARIPDTPLSLEFVLIAPDGGTGRYLRFAGAGLIDGYPTSPADEATAQRTKFILGLAPARLP